MDFGHMKQAMLNNKGTILAGFAVVGVFATAILSGRAAVKVHEELKMNPDMDKKSKAKLYAKSYAATAVSASATVACIIGSDRAHVGKEVAIASAATAWHERYNALNQKASEKLGPEEAAKMHNELKEEEVRKSRESENTYESSNMIGNRIWVYEPITDQYIRTTMERVSIGMFRLNKKIIDEGDVRVNFLINILGGTPTPEGAMYGWNIENVEQTYQWSRDGRGLSRIPWVDYTPEVHKRTDGREALCLFYTVEPRKQVDEEMIYYR